jgi:hypothetical protein
MRRFRVWGIFVWLLGFATVHAHARATLLLEEPYSVDGTFAGTGHVAVYLDRICADSPLVLRRCAAGEKGIVLSRYHGIAGRDWFAIPLIPYLYAVDRAEKIPIYADVKLEAFLRNQYRRNYLQDIIPDTEDGEPPQGPWVQLVGSAYDRTLYAFEIETSPQKDDELIRLLNDAPNVARYKLLSANCADFVRGIVNFYYPRALHRSVIADLGVTTPKQIAKCLVRYSKHHPELRYRTFLIPQVPGTIKRSKPVRGVVESAFKAKKYMIPLLAWHPAIVAGFAAAYFTGGGFDPSRHALVFDPSRDLEPPMSAQQRIESMNQLEQLKRSTFESDGVLQDAKWRPSASEAEPLLDEAGRPMLRVRVGASAVPVDVGISRENILNQSQSVEVARSLVLARLREELRKNPARVAYTDVERDLQLLQEIDSLEAERQRLASQGEVDDLAAGSQRELDEPTTASKLP